MRRLAKLLPYLAVLFLLLIALFLFLRSATVTKYLTAAISGELARQTDRHVAIKHASVSLSGRVVLRDLLIENSDGSPLLTCPLATARVGRPGTWLPILSGPLDVKEVTLIGPQITIARRADGSLSIADLAARKPEARPFRGRVAAREGKVIFVDNARGGLTTTLEEVNLALHYPKPDQPVFRLRAQGPEGAFGLLEARGESSPERGTHISGSLADLDLAYALDRLAQTNALTISAGRADVKGELTVSPPGSSDNRVNYEVQLQASQAEIAFPWLRRPVKDAHGTLRFVNGDLRLDQAAGTIADAPVEVTGLISNLQQPELALDISATGLRVKQVEALLPNIYVPAALMLPAPVRIRARAEGPASDVEVTGRAEVRVIKFRLVPWNDVVAKFRYRRGRLAVTGLSAHGSPRRLDADLEVTWGEGRQQAQADIRLTRVPVSVLAQMAGMETTDLTGLASIAGKVSIAGPGLTPLISGEAALEQAAFRDLPLGRITGLFRFSADALTLRAGRIEGPAARGTFSAQLILPDRYQVQADLTSLDLTMIGPALGLPALRGDCPVALKVSGRLNEPQAAGQVELGPGRLQDRPFDTLRASFDISPNQISLRDVILAQGAGQYRGQLAIANWQQAGAAALSGAVTISRADPRAWLPQQWAGSLPETFLDGAAAVSGTRAVPQVEVDLSIKLPVAAGMDLEIGRARLRYQQNRLLVEEAVLSDGVNHFRLTGEYSRDTGLDFELVGEPLEVGALAAELRARYGLALTGQAALRADITGSLADPRATLRAISSPLTVNDIVLDEVSLSGAYRGGAVHLQSATVRRKDTKIEISGQVGILSDHLDLTCHLHRLDLLTIQLIANSAAWRLDQLGATVPHRELYILIPRPLGGHLTGDVRVTGTRRNPQAEVTAEFDALSFAGRRIDYLKCDLGLSRENIQVSLEAKHEQAHASLSGYIRPRADLFIQADIGNLDLGLLRPWLQSELDLSGKGTINFDISGQTARPVLRGDISVREFRLGPVSFEAADANPIWLRPSGLLTVEEIRLRNGPLEGVGSATIPLHLLINRRHSGPARDSTQPASANDNDRPRAELHLTNASLALVPGMTPAVFHADVYLRDDKLWIGAPPEREGEEQTAPVQGTMGEGRFSLQGKVDIESYAPAAWAGNRFDVTADLDQVEVNIANLVKGKLGGRILLTTTPETGRPVLKTTSDHPLVFSHATLGLADGKVRLPPAPPFAAPVDLQVRVSVGPEVWFRYGAKERPTEIKIDPDHALSGEGRTGYLQVGGVLSAADLTLKGEAESHQGRLVFPNGTLTLRSAKARIQREPGALPRIEITAEADGRVGDYYVSINPTGQIYPPPAVPISLNAVSLPHLEEGYVLALLVGPLVSPTRGGTHDFGALLTRPGMTPGTGGEVTGIRWPPLGGALGVQELSLDLTLQGPVRLRLGERLFRRVIVSYVSTLNAPSESRTLRFTYEVNPGVSMGWSVDEFNRTRWEVQSFIPF